MPFKCLRSRPAGPPAGCVLLGKLHFALLLTLVIRELAPLTCWGVSTGLCAQTWGSIWGSLCGFLLLTICFQGVLSERDLLGHLMLQSPGSHEGKVQCFLQ